jgi:hypothetical protein
MARLLGKLFENKLLLSSSSPHNRLVRALVDLFEATSISGSSSIERLRLMLLLLRPPLLLLLGIERESKSKSSGSSFVLVLLPLKKSGIKEIKTLAKVSSVLIAAASSGC